MQQLHNFSPTKTLPVSLLYLPSFNTAYMGSGNCVGVDSVAIYSQAETNTGIMNKDTVRYLIILIYIPRRVMH
jgi:hypothetical protein